MPAEELARLLRTATDRLRAAGVETPELDARLLLQAATSLSREEMIMEPRHLVPQAQAMRFDSLVQRRAAHEPVSRILGVREFYGRSFRVTPATLDPRPDTETLVEAALALMPPGARILDLGTGTGAIAVTLLAERPDASGVATDISPEALVVAKENARRHGLGGRLTFAEGSWFAPITGVFDMILSNPPYIPDLEIEGLSPDVRNFDPRLALAGGDDGLDPYRAIAAQSAPYLTAGGHVLVEIGAGQEADVTAIFAGDRFSPAGEHRDLGGHPRCLVFRRG